MHEVILFLHYEHLTFNTKIPIISLSMQHYSVSSQLTRIGDRTNLVNCTQRIMSVNSFIISTLKKMQTQ